MGCSLCNTIHPNARFRRGLYYCPVGHMYINADVNGSLNKDEVLSRRN